MSTKKLDDDDPLGTLCKLLDGAKVTFSKNCASGILGKAKCNCWRCRQGRGEPVTEETEALAEKEAVEAHKKLVESFRPYVMETMAKLMMGQTRVKPKKKMRAKPKRKK